MRRLRSSLASILVTMFLAPHVAPLMAWFDGAACVCVKATCCCPARPEAAGPTATRCHQALGGTNAAVRCRHADDAVVRHAPAVVPPPISLIARSSERVAFPANASSVHGGFQRVESPPPRAPFLSA